MCFGWQRYHAITQAEQESGTGPSALKDAMDVKTKNRTVAVYVKMMTGMAGG